MNTKTLFNQFWTFLKQPIECTLEEIQHKKDMFKAVEVPHDWLIYDTSNLYETSSGWYRKTFEYNVKKQESLVLRFDGVYMNSTIYINGQKAGEWKYGYTTFEVDCTAFLQDGINEVIVQVRHEAPNSRWYSGAGIYRNVWLIKKANNHIVSDGVYVSIKEQQEKWEVDIETHVNINGKAQLRQSVIYEDQLIASDVKMIDSGSIIEEDTSSTTVQQLLEVVNPKLWDIESPTLYQLKTELIVEEETIELQCQNIGFRSIKLDANKGFFMNGHHLKLNGVCEHHDLGCLGAAFNKIAMKRRLHLLKEMGVNAIRTAHNMPAPELMELTDEMGFLVVSEAFDMWERPKTTYDYARFFKEWAKRDVERWVKRDRNHPSLIMWSIGNEIYDTHADERGQEITRKLMEYVLEFDPKKNGIVTIGSNYMPWENAQKCAEIVKIAGYNYGEKYYEEHHKKNPEWIIYGSETSSIVQSRGIYHFPYETSILADDDLQCSALGNSTTSWGARSIEECITYDRDTFFSLGQFIWTGFDYIGEPTPYHTKNSYFGQLDTAGFKKDSYYIYQSAWTDYRKSPMIHIFPYWDFNEGQTVDVRVCTNAPRMELKFNEELIGVLDIDHQHGKKIVGHWKIPYQKGELVATAFDEEGNIIAVEKKRSFSDAKKICLDTDCKVIKADGKDLAFVEISMKDKEGNTVENANNRVNVCVKGAGVLLGLDNGDSTDYDQYKGNSRRLFSGKLLAVIGSTLECGEIVVEVSSEGIKTEVTKLEAIDVELQGEEKLATNLLRDQQCSKDIEFIGEREETNCEIPVRKIELLAKSGQQFSEELKTVEVEAKLYPENASYNDVEWRVVNDSGIDSNIAHLETCGQVAKITARGDGKFNLRCMVRNGLDHANLISQLGFEASGLGITYKNPYQAISAGLYDYTLGEVSNGNERGVATSRDGQTQVGFKDIDFGKFGSDRITLSIFALTDEEYPIEIWEGIPNEEGSRMLDKVIYQKESKWNVYQEETYQLPKRLTGITSITFVLTKKVHIKEFIFEKLNKAYEKLYVKECNALYGDSFKMERWGVGAIGNNVTLAFDEMDFGEAGATKLVLCGQAINDMNTVCIKAQTDQQSSSQVVEFENSDDFIEKTFEIEKIVGKGKIEFVFLPGSSFNFKWFRFIKD